MPVKNPQRKHDISLSEQNVGVLSDVHFNSKPFNLDKFKQYQQKYKFCIYLNLLFQNYAPSYIRKCNALIKFSQIGLK